MTTDEGRMTKDEGRKTKDNTAVRWRRWTWPVVVMGVLLVLSACGPRPLLSKVSFAPDLISPNGDGAADATKISYELGRNASVSIYLTPSDGQRHYFRQDQPRSAGAYGVLFSGVIDGRLLPDGEYRWTVEASDESGQAQSAEGKLTLSGGESTAPEITRLQHFAPRVHAEPRRHLGPRDDQRLAE